MNKYLENIKTLEDVTKCSNELQRFLREDPFTEESTKELINMTVSEDTLFTELVDIEILTKMRKLFMKAFEDKCEEIIKNETGQEKISIGTKIKLKYDFHGNEPLKKGTTLTITDVTRFDEDTFGQGWYIYGTNYGRLLYRNEFDLIDNGAE